MKTHLFLQKRPPFSSSSSSSSSSCSPIDSPLTLLLSHLLLPWYVFLSFSSIIHCFLFYLQTAFHFRLLLGPPIFRFSFLVQCSPLLALYRSLARSLSLSLSLSLFSVIPIFGYPFLFLFLLFPSLGSSPLSSYFPSRSSSRSSSHSPFSSYCSSSFSPFYDRASPLSQSFIC